MLRVFLLVGPPLLVGLVASVIALDARNSGDAFTAGQRHLHALEPAEVERVVSTAPAPIDPAKNGKASARCASRGSGKLGNPWLCALRYRSGLTVRYLVTVQSNGEYLGERQSEPRIGFIRGCCIQILA